MTRVTGIAPQPYAIQIDASAGAHGGIAQTLSGRVAPGWHVLEVDVTLLSGALTGSGIYMHWGPSGGVAYSDSTAFTTALDITGAAPGAGTVNKLYKFRKLVNVITASDLFQMFVMSHWEGFGQSIASANSLKFHRAALRPASQAEIEARQATTDLVTANATISSHTSSIATNTSAISSLTTSVAARFTADQKNSQNMLRNSTFRDVSYWETSGGAPISFAQAYRDHVYVYMAGGGGTNYRAIYQDVQVQEGARYALSGDIYSDNSNDARLFIQWLNSDRSASVGGNSGYNGVWTNPTPWTWSRVKFDINNANNDSGYGLVAPTGAVWARIYCDNYPGSASAGGAAFRRIKFERGDYATAWREDDGLVLGLENASALATTNANVASNTSAIATESSARAAAVEEVRAYLSGKGDCIHDEFRDNTFWNLPLSGVSLIDTDGGWRWRRAIQLSNGTYDLYSDFFPVEPGATYRIRCRIWNNAGSWSGYFHPLIHMPNLGWYSLKHGAAVDPSFHDASNGIVAAGDTGNLEWIFTNPTGILDNANRQWQFRFYGSFTGGPVVVACEIVRLDQYAAVTTNTSAIATVDGKLSASYALTVDGNGRIASMKLLSDGTTSSIKFTASTFTVYDGTSDVPMFELSGGAAYVAGSRVRTESMAANAVTVADDDETDANQNVGSSWVAVASCDLTTIDAASRALIMFSAYIESSTDGSLMDARIKRGSDVIWGPKPIAGDPPSLDFETTETGAVSYTPPFNGMVSFFDTDVPGAAGSYTYTIELRVAGSVSSPWVASYRRMFGMIFKR